jgi:hypothetical protein
MIIFILYIILGKIFQIKDKHSEIFSLIKYDIKYDIRIYLFNFLNKNIGHFLQIVKKEFIYQIYENLKPKVFSKRKNFN